MFLVSSKTKRLPKVFIYSFKLVSGAHKKSKSYLFEDKSINDQINY